ncbi:MAG: hypothetical protein LBL18_04520, partial [Bacteroidales bacterium]|nr:hypothetical protein [Bacteroidales bacterium]
TGALLIPSPVEAAAGVAITRVVGTAIAKLRIVRYVDDLRLVTKVEIPTWRGSGPAPGVLGVNSNSTSVAAIKNYYPSEAIEFVFDPKTNTFVVGRPQSTLFTGSSHEQLARSIGADETSVVGGTFRRAPNGEIFTTENSGHYGTNWTDSIRQQFEQVMNAYGLPVNHTNW